MDAFTSLLSLMLQDMEKGRKTEIDGLIFEVVRLAIKTGVAAPVYSMVAKHFGYKIYPN